jgi:hypothetical protein
VAAGAAPEMLMAAGATAAATRIIGPGPTEYVIVCIVFFFSQAAVHIFIAVVDQ